VRRSTLSAAANGSPFGRAGRIARQYVTPPFHHVLFAPEIDLEPPDRLKLLLALASEQDWSAAREVSAVA
jgi:hypothetical protein